ncbi:ArsR family transcriptional regulator, partial [Streptomyces sp. 8K308]
LRGRAAPDGWAGALPYSRGTVRLTADELRELFEAYIALLNRYKRPEAETPPGARTVYTRFLAFPDAFAEPDDDQAEQTGETAE